MPRRSCSTQFGWPMWATVPVAGVLAALFGVAIGGITLRLQGPFFVIVTLAFAEVLRLVANNWIGLTNGPMGIAGVPQPELLADASNLGAKQFYFYVALVAAGVALYLSYRFVNSNAGRAAVAVRENRYVAQSVGIRPFLLCDAGLRARRLPGRAWQAASTPTTSPSSGPRCSPSPSWSA
jgi:branched-chain amino acid transport system permease protein